MLSASALAGALLTVSQMPTGWSKDAPSDASDAGTLCNYTEPVKPKLTKSQNWTKGSLGPVASTILRQYASAQDAAKAFKALQGAIGCGSFTSKGERFTIAEVSFPQLGQGTVAVRLSVASGGELVETYVLDGPTLVQVGEGGLSSDVDVAEKILRAQVDAYEKAAF
ncbi:MAG: hypothetical protein ACTHQ3_00520 [Motilibacteraceae bacterium]